MLLTELQYNDNKQVNNQTLLYAFCFSDKESNSQYKPQSASISIITTITARLV